MGRIVLFTTASCKHCKRAKAILEQYEVPINEVNLLQYPARKDEMLQLSGGKRTVPQIFFNAEHIGGADDLEAIHNEGTLQSRLEACLQAPDDGPEPPTVEEKEEQESISREELEFDSLFHRMHANKGAALNVKDRRYRVKIVKRCFKASSMLQWLRTNIGVGSSDAIRIAMRMMELGYFYRVDSRTNCWSEKGAFRFYQDKDRRTLNMSRVWGKPARPAAQAAADFVSTLLLLQDKFFTDGGRAIDYEGIKKSAEFAEYRVKALELQKVDVENLSNLEKKAFFINVYNALVIHANVARGAPTNGIQRSIFFNSVGYIIGGFKYTLNEIENGILRGNQKPVGALFVPFGKKDRRADFIIPRFEFDPRIHFALVCGAKSCPPVRVFSASNVEEALQLATEGFVNEEVVVQSSKQTASGKKVQLSMLFKWYAKDFGSTQTEILQWISAFHFDREFHELLSQEGPAVKVRYATYDWNPNNRSYDGEDAPVAEGNDVSFNSHSSNSLTMSQMSSDLLTCESIDEASDDDRE